jgi:hypothetical protein
MADQERFLAILVRRPALCSSGVSDIFSIDSRTQGGKQTVDAPAIGAYQWIQYFRVTRGKARQALAGS